MFTLNDNLIAHFSENRSYGRWDIIAYITRRRWCHNRYFFPRFPFSSIDSTRPWSLFCLAYFPVRENYFFFLCHVKYNVDITPACYSNPLIFMSYNSRASRKSRGLLKLFRRMILSSSHSIGTSKPTEPYPLLMATGIRDI